MSHSGSGVALARRLPVPRRVLVVLLVLVLLLLGPQVACASMPEQTQAESTGGAGAGACGCSLGRSRGAASAAGGAEVAEAEGGMERKCEAEVRGGSAACGTEELTSQGASARHLEVAPRGMEGARQPNQKGTPPLVGFSGQADMAHIPGRLFFMGTQQPGMPGDGEAPRRPVRVSSFLMDRYECSNEQFAAFVADTGYSTESEAFGW